MRGWQREVMPDRNRLAEAVTHKLQDSFYINVSWDALNTAYSELPKWFSGGAPGMSAKWHLNRSRFGKSVIE